MNALAIKAIRGFVAHQTDVPLTVIDAWRPGQGAVRARSLAIWISQRLTKATLNDLAEQFSAKDVTQISRAIVRVDRWLLTDSGFAESVNAMLASLGHPPLPASAVADANVPRIATIVDYVSGVTGVGLTMLFSGCRRAKTVSARHMAIWLTRRLTTHSLPAIGRHFGGRDHTTIMHACRRWEARMEADTAAAHLTLSAITALEQPAQEAA